MTTKNSKAGLELNEEDLKILNSELGRKMLFSDKKLNVERALRLTKYELELQSLQEQLIKLQKWVVAKRKKVVVLFEGRDAAGKGGAIRRITAHINPRQYRIVALAKPTEEEEGQWYFQRYVNQLPKPGEIVFFDRSWYNRAVVEPVNGFCTEGEYQVFMGQVNDFERMVMESDTTLIKFWFSISKEEQACRFRDIKADPRKKWKMSPVDEKAQELWKDYTRYKEAMFAHTDLPHSPWIILKADSKRNARLRAMQEILSRVPWENLPELEE
ncbi:MAG: polyphosphate kinase 2 [Bacteroidota bacterium]